MESTPRMSRLVSFYTLHFRRVRFIGNTILIKRILPVRKEVLTGVLSCDLVGFHTYDYARHFLSSFQKFYVDVLVFLGFIPLQMALNILGTWYL